MRTCSVVQIYSSYRFRARCSSVAPLTADFGSLDWARIALTSDHIDWVAQMYMNIKWPFLVQFIIRLPLHTHCYQFSNPKLTALTSFRCHLSFLLPSRTSAPPHPWHRPRSCTYQLDGSGFRFQHPEAAGRRQQQQQTLRGARRGPYYGHTLYRSALWRCTKTVEIRTSDRCVGLQYVTSLKKLVVGMRLTAYFIPTAEQRFLDPLLILKARAVRDTCIHPRGVLRRF